MTEQPKRKFLDANHPMFRRPWVRWVTGLLPIGWGVFELTLNEPFWGLIFIAAGGYALWELVYKGPDAE